MDPKAAQPTAKPAPVAAVAPAAAPKVAKPATPKAPPKEKTVAGHKLTAVINMGKNKEGKLYGPDNNPKRADTACHARFANYRDGMTIDAALKAGLQAGDIAFDKNPTRAYISVKDV